MDKKYGEKVCSIASPSGAAPEAWSGIHMQRGANAQLIARLSPSVVLAIIEALESATHHFEGDEVGTVENLKVKHALALLDGKNTEI